MGNHHLSGEFGFQQVIPGGGSLNVGVRGQPICVGCKPEGANINANPLVINILHFYRIDQIGKIG